ncbi:MAG: VWA domain-containing protein [Bdellovibrionaceae bacterium]|nr:VWA domain-containing protein [Pseudobdellovibrionaceae bacterium]
MNQLTWSNSWVLWIGLPFLVLWFVMYFFSKRSFELPLATVTQTPAVPAGPRVWLARYGTWLWFFVSLFLLLALARPQRASTQVQRNVEGIDILITLDISDSMLIEDMKPLNRLEAAKEVVMNFVNARSNDRIGVVIFAGEAFTLIPPTLDYELVKQRVSELTTAKDARIKDGTALGVALAASAGRLKNSKAKSRVLIFLTDGENNSGTIDPETGLEIVKGFGIKIYSIALGRSGPTRIPVYGKGVFGNKIKSYQPFTSTVNEEFLTQVAEQTGGKFFSAYDEKMLSRVFQEIDSLEKTKVESKTYTRYEELYSWPLQVGFFLAILGLSIERFWLRRFPPC